MVSSSKLLFSFTIDHLKNEWVDILSVQNNKLLISCYQFSQLFIYSQDGLHLSTISTNGKDKLRDAAWTPGGNIVYTAYNNNKVVVLSESGEVIATSQLTAPRYLSVSNDDTIYLADMKTGVYQSTDDGVSWNLVFKSTDGWHCAQVIKVTTDHFNDYWTLGTFDKWCLRVYSVDENFDYEMSWKDIDLITKDGEQINFDSSKLAYDGDMNMFLRDYHNKAVHILSTNGEYHCQLLSPNDLSNTPCRLAVDKERELLYVGQSDSVVEVFHLKSAEIIRPDYLVDTPIYV